ncbi:hypothetical protein JCM10908_007251 [Rhodotorula pacifica]|uniref:uncharacterized protein n=1 Tax=Rhodotorula pacifica TaxID=1495444 RepID=UPI003182662A
MATHMFSSAKDGLATDANSLAGAVLRRLVLTEADLPEGIQFLPSLFRLLAFLLFLPVSVLTAVDLVGWIFFKAVLRPLGYASTIRFKDPEPPSMLFAPGVDKSRPESPASSTGVLPSDESSSCSSGASDAYPSPAFSDNLSLPDVDSFPPPAQERNTSSSSSKSSRKRSKRKEGSGSVDESSTTFRMSRDRAPSVGLDGPLFGDETDGATTPGTDSDASDYMSVPRSLPGAGDFAGSRSLRGDGVPRGGFKLGLTEVSSRPNAASSGASQARDE